MQNKITVPFDPDGNLPLYEQIYRYIRDEIKIGHLAEGDKLPSTRRLSDHLQVSRTTVDTAYDQLLSEGYIEARPYRGYYVCPVEELFVYEKSNKKLVDRSVGIREETGEEHRFSRTNRDKDRMMNKDENHKPENQTSFRVDFSPYATENDEFPLGIWRKINKDLLLEERLHIFSRGNAQGEWELRETISRYLRGSRDVEASPEQIVIGAGNDYLLMLLHMMFCAEMGHKKAPSVAMESPTYPGAYNLFTALGCEMHLFSTDEHGPVVEELKGRDLDAVYVMPSHQFPTGAVMPIGRRMELLRYAASSPHCYIIEDDYDSEYRFRGKPIPALQASDSAGRVIYIGTFSKAIAPAIRVSYMVLPDHLLPIFHKVLGFLSCTVPRPDQMILREFLEQGSFEKHLNRMRKIYRGKMDVLLEEMAPLEGRFTIRGKDAGLHILLTGPCKDEKLTALAAKEGVKIYPLSAFYPGKQPEDTFSRCTVLLGFGGLKEEEIRLGAELLKKAWSQ
ncbi:MAG: PLP-dependent aminotransferase family protein [Lachnospiraceae bacterium]|nr:PLP-dependent aminotransferase family protein [Lachnospiraceae bacterium]